MATMNTPDSESLSICYRDDGWLKTHALTGSTVLDYFQTSPFYIPGAILDRGEQAQEDGPVPFAGSDVCYARRPETKEEEAAGVFSLERRERGVVTGLYLVLQGTLIRAPPLRDLIIARAGRAAFHLKNALQTLRELEEAQGREARAQ
jgi:hypothetical protein